MKPIVTKIGIGVLGAGTIGTGVLFATYSNKDNSYEKYLNENGRKLIEDSSNLWDTAKDNYNNDDGHLLITLGDKKIEKKQLQVEQLKTWCSQNSKKEFTNTKDPIYQRVSAWCTEPKTIEQKIGNSKTILDDTEPSGSNVTNKDEQIWKQKETEYKLAGNADLIKEIASNNEGDVIQINGAITTAKLRTWCKHSKAKNFKHEEEKRYLTYLKWCTK